MGGEGMDYQSPDATQQSQYAANIQQTILCEIDFESNRGYRFNFAAPRRGAPTFTG